MEDRGWTNKCPTLLWAHQPTEAAPLASDAALPALRTMWGQYCHRMASRGWDPPQCMVLWSDSLKWNVFPATQYQIYVINSSITSSANHFIKTSTLILHFRIRNNYHFLYFSSGQLLTACRPPALANIRLENLSLNIDQISENQIKINHSKQENNYWTYWLYFKSPTFHQHQLSAVFCGLLEGRSCAEILNVFITSYFASFLYLKCCHCWVRLPLSGPAVVQFIIVQAGGAGRRGGEEAAKTE